MTLMKPAMQLMRMTPQHLKPTLPTGRDNPEVETMHGNAPQKRLQGSNRNASHAGAPTACCSVCGSESVVCDEVVGEEILQLGECLHCEYRWTWPGGALIAMEVSDPGRRPTLAGVRLPPKLPSAA